jgi:hypothetical protein
VSEPPVRAALLRPLGQERAPSRAAFRLVGYFDPESPVVPAARQQEQVEPDRGDRRHRKLPAPEVARIRSAVEDLLDRIAAGNAADGPVQLRAGWDEYDVRVTLTYSGALPMLPSNRSQKELVDEQAFISGLAGFFSHLGADRIEPSLRGDACGITLVFRL